MWYAVVMVTNTTGEVAVVETGRKPDTTGRRIVSAEERDVAGGLSSQERTIVFDTYFRSSSVALRSLAASIQSIVFSTDPT